MRWSASSRLRSYFGTQLAIRSRRPLAAGSRTYLRPHRTVQPQRVLTSPSRASSTPRFRPRQSPTRNTEELSQKSFSFRNGGQTKDLILLYSAFPTKTVLFLLVLGGLAYYFIEVREEDWTDDIYTSYTEDQNQATPLHFYANKEQLDHWIQFHIPDPSAPLKDPNVAQFFSEQFDKLAFGWMMTKEEARKEDMPVTHGVRFRSNEPCRITMRWVPLLAPGRSRGTTGVSWTATQAGIPPSTYNGR